MQYRTLWLAFVGQSPLNVFFPHRECKMDPFHPSIEWKGYPCVCLDSSIRLEMQWTYNMSMRERERQVCVYVYIYIHKHRCSTGKMERVTALRPAQTNSADTQAQPAIYRYIYYIYTYRHKVYRYIYIWTHTHIYIQKMCIYI